MGGDRASVEKMMPSNGADIKGLRTSVFAKDQIAWSADDPVARVASRTVIAPPVNITLMMSAARIAGKAPSGP